MQRIQIKLFCMSFPMGCSWTFGAAPTERIFLWPAWTVIVVNVVINLIYLGDQATKTKRRI